MRFIIGLVLLAALGLAHAQVAVVTSCGTASYSAGQSKPATQTTTGDQCIDTSGGASSVVQGSGTAGSPAGGVLTVQGAAGATPQPVIQGAPVAANILNGYLSAAGTLLTIPAGRTWVGIVSMQGVLANAPGGALVAGAITLATAGAGVTPTAGNYFGVTLEVSAASAAGNGNQIADHLPPTPCVIIAPVGNAVTLVAGGALTGQNFSAIGALQ